MDRITSEKLTPLTVETAERLQNARARGDRRQVAYLTGVKAALADLREHHAEAAREAEREAKRRAEAEDSAKLTAMAFNGGDWMGQGEKS